MVSSGVWAGELPLETAHSLKENGPQRRTMKQELERIGYLGNMDASHKVMPLGVYCSGHSMQHVIAYVGGQAHFELHIGEFFSFLATVYSPKLSDFRDGHKEWHMYHRKTLRSY